MKRPLISFTVAFALLVAFLGVSLKLDDRNENTLQLAVSGLPELSAAENSWGFVRHSATWAKSNNTFLESIVNSLKDNNLLKSDATYQVSDRTFGKIIAKIELTVGTTGAPAATGISSAAYTGTKDFTYRLYVWNQENNQKVLELFFDDPDAFGSVGHDGALLKYALKRLDPTTYTGNDVITESYLSGATGSRQQTLSWNNGPFIAGGPTRNGRVVLREIHDGSQLEFRSVVLLNETTEGTIKASVSGICNSASDLYYVMAFMQKVSGSAEATAKYGVVADPAVDPDTICGVIANPQNYGLFAGGAFELDGVAAASIPSNFPPASAVSPSYDAALTPPHVDDAFSRTGTASGLTAYEDTSKAVIDGLNITFHSTAAPGF